MKNNKIIQLYIAFFRIGIFTFGGGYAMLPMLIKEIVENKKWASEEELLSYFAISQTTPGIIAVNTATFIGMKQKGIPGAIAGTIGVVSPCWLVISLIAGILNQVKDNLYVSQAFMGIRVVVLALIIHSVIRMAKKAVKGYYDLFVLLLGSILIVGAGIKPVIVILGLGFIGTILSPWLEKEKKHAS